MTDHKSPFQQLQRPLELPCGTVIKNRIAKSPMSDSLGDGEGNPTEKQIRLYEKWSQGGVGLSLIGEVQIDPHFPEKPGNLVLSQDSNQQLLKQLTQRAAINNTHIWAQLGHAGALTHLEVNHPIGPSSLNLKGLECDGMSSADIKALPTKYAQSALIAKSVGFTGIQIHAGHGFLLSQFLSPLFNHRDDAYGSDVVGRVSLIIEIVNEVRLAVGAHFPIGIRINSSDLLEGGLTEEDALKVISLLDQTSVDLLDISGGTYFPEAKSSSEGTKQGVYFLEFAKKAKAITHIPLMLTGGFKTRNQAIHAIESGSVDMIGLGRAMIVDFNLANSWLSHDFKDPHFPKFKETLPGGITAWYTMRLTAIGEDSEDSFDMDLATAIKNYEARDALRSEQWKKKFKLLV